MEFQIPKLLQLLHLLYTEKHGVEKAEKAFAV